MKTIVHVIDSLGVGGAETLLKSVVIDLKEYQHVVVYLFRAKDKEIELPGITKVFLDFSRKTKLFKVVQSLRKVVVGKKADLVHSHLYWSTIVSRLALPSGVGLVQSYHSLLYEPANKAQYSLKMLLLDRLTYRRQYHMIFVSNAVQSLICSKIGVSRNYSVLYNFVEDCFFTAPRGEDIRNDKLRTIALGNLRQEKNYRFLIETFSKISGDKAALHIYGGGTQELELKKLIENNADEHIALKGKTDKPHQVFQEYSLFVSASRFEGFGIAVAEAMASGLPCLLSDIPAHRELAGDSAMYFDPESTDSLLKRLNAVLKQPAMLNDWGLRCYKRAHYFSKSSYMRQLRELYSSL